MGLTYRTFCRRKSHVVASSIRIYRIPNNTTRHKGRTYPGFEAGDDQPQWARPEVEDQERNEQLRELVDRLQPAVRHVVERVHFGQATLRAAALDAGITPARASKLLAQGEATLKLWLENPDLAPKREQRPVKAAPGSKTVKCGVITRWGPCQQPVVCNGPCAAHLEWQSKGITPDPGYHRSIALGEREPIQSKLTQTEMDVTLYGRYKGDGRRTDAYAGFEPLEIDLG